MSDPPSDPRTPSSPDAYDAPTQYVPVTDYSPGSYAPDAYATDAYATEAYDDDRYGSDGYGEYGAPPPDPSGLIPDPVRVQTAPRPRVRKVSRVVRAIDAWSVFKISLLFYLALYVICLIAGVLLWNVAYSTGTIDNVSNFFESFGWKSFEFRGGEIYHNAWILGLFLVVGLTGLNVVLVTLFNLLADLVGGVRLTVLEEEVVLRRVGEPDTVGVEALGVGSTSPLVEPTRTPSRWRLRR